MRRVRWIERRAAASASFALVLAALLTVPAHAQGDAALDALRQRLQAKLDSVHAAGRFPGATLGVVLADGRSFGLAVGLADTVRREPMRTDHRMLQGSVGKTYFAAVALQASARWQARSR
jgi:CubicO group peptidase (beta-lactamase class C family)